MSISVTGLGSGLDYDSWIEALVKIKKEDITAVSSKITAISDSQDTLSEIKDSYSALLDSIKNFTTTISKNNVFNQKTATSSSEAVSVEVSAYAKAQDINVTVSQLATATVAKSTSNVTSYIDSATKISDIANGSITEGVFSIYLNGAKNEINVTSGMTMGDLLTSINDNASLDGVTASLSADGKLTIGADTGFTGTLSLSSSSDTTNFVTTMGLAKNGNTYTSNKSLSETNTTGALTGATYANGAVTAGYFTIGNAEFEVTSSTTIDDVVDQINKSTNAGVSAYWDPTAGKLTLTAKDEGAININLETGADSLTGESQSNFLYIMGLTKADGTTLADNTQAIGQNAIFSVNGTTITSSSNTVSSDVTGITGLTLTLNNTTTSAAKVSVATDNTKVTAAVTTFVDALNKVITSTDDATGSSGDLYGESILKSLKNKIRNLATAKVDGADSSYDVLAEIGITTKLTTNKDGSKTTSFVLNEDKLTAALKDNPNSVEKFLIGDGTTDGVFDKLQTVVDDSLDNVDGYFRKKDQSFDKQINRYQDKVSKMTNNLEKYQARLEEKFGAMDKLISSLKQSSSIFDSYFNKSSSSSSS